MKQLPIRVFALACALPLTSWAQQIVSGTVTDENNIQLPGAAVVVQNTTRGTTTDFDGKYQIQANEGDTLIFSYVGYITQLVTVGSSTTVTVQMQISGQLEEVVVTAFGIERTVRKLGYLVENVSGNDLTESANTNLATALQGKVAGIDIQSGATGPGSSTNINIRGVNSLSGNNQPLLVVDGVIVSNTNIGQGDFAGGFDFGDGYNSINPDDIESVNVLKGGNASALYGHLGVNGVIVITTKKGRTYETQIEINSSATFENVLVSPKFQNEYGQGRFDTDTNTLIYDIERGESWGPKLDDSQRERFDGVGTVPYSSSSGGFEDFYTTGVNLVHSIIISQAKDDYDYKLSYSNLTNSSIQDGTDFRKHNFGFKAGIKPNDNWKITGKVDYAYQKGRNRPELTDGQSNTVKALSLKPRNISNRLLEDNYLDDEGAPNNWAGSFIMNPYYSSNTRINEDSTNRYLGLISVEADLFEGLKATARLSQDQSVTNAFIYRKKNAFDIAPNGKLDEFNTEAKLNSYDLILNYRNSIDESFDIDLTIGFNHIDDKFKSIVNIGETFVEDNVFSFNNFESKNINPRLVRSSSNSVYASATIGFKDYLFAEVTVRNDWSSTLPVDDSSFFYPSIGFSFVASDAFPSIENSDVFSFLKFRGGYAEVGNATRPYSLQNTYLISSSQYNDQLFFFFGTAEEGAGRGPSLRNPNLVAELSETFEFGIDARFFNNRLQFDATYYSTETSNQILELSLPPSSGASSQFENAGLITNKGWEFGLSSDIINNDRFSWTADVNLSTNRNKIEALVQDIEVQIRERQFNDVVQVGAQLGESLWTLFGATYERDDDGEIVYDSDGLPVVGGIGKIGSTNPDMLGGLKNTFTYDNLRLSILLDSKFGGDVFSFSDLLRASSGTDAITLRGREYFTGGNGIMVPEGATISGGGTLDEDVVARGVNPQLYWGRVSQISEHWVQDASYVKLREISLEYNFGENVLKSLGVSKLSLSYIGRNLAILHKNTSNFDPETGFNNSFSGVEYFGFPSTSSHGLRLNILF